MTRTRKRKSSQSGPSRPSIATQMQQPKWIFLGVFLLLSVAVGLQYLASHAATGQPDFVSGLTSSDSSGANVFYCLDNFKNRHTNGNPIVLWTCDGSAGERITFNNGLIHASGMCMATLNGGTAAGTPVHVWTCNGNRNQQWTVTGTSHILNIKANKCLSAGSINNLGTQLTIQPCSGALNMQWFSSVYNPPVTDPSSSPEPTGPPVPSIPIPSNLPSVPPTPTFFPFHR